MQDKDSKKLEPAGKEPSPEEEKQPVKEEARRATQKKAWKQQKEKILYPILQQYFAKYKNISVVLEVIEQHFYNLFDLATLEQIVKAGVPSDDDRYFRAFSLCVEKLSDCYTEEEIIDQLTGLLNHDSGYNYRVVSYPIKDNPRLNEFLVAHDVENGVLHYRVITPDGNVVNSTMTMQEIWDCCSGNKEFYSHFVYSLIGQYETLFKLDKDEAGNTCLRYSYQPGEGERYIHAYISLEEVKECLGDDYNEYIKGLANHAPTQATKFLPKILTIPHKRGHTNQSKINPNYFLPFLDRLLKIPVAKGHCEDKAINKLLVKNLVFVADDRGLQGEQLGYFERLLSGKAKPAEGLSLVDMLRLTSGMEAINRPEVVSLAALSYRVSARATTNFLVNVNPNLQGIPKWVAISLQGKAVIYCESRLSEAEKQQLETAIKQSVPNATLQYEACRATGGMSSGYLAVGWLLENMRCNTLYGFEKMKWDLTSSFWKMRNTFFQCFFRKEDTNCNQPKVDYYCETTDRDCRYFSPAMRHFFQQHKQKYNIFEWLVALEKSATIPPYMHDAHQMAAARMSGIEKHGPSTDSIREMTETLVGNVIPFKLDQYIAHLGDKNVSCDMTVFCERYINICIRNRTEYNKMWGGNHEFTQDQKERVLIQGLLSVFNDYASQKSLTFIYKGKPRAVEALSLFEQDCIAYLVSEMRYNAFLQHFIIPNDNPDPVFTEIVRQINPILARNRWLAQNRYHPPLMADHWQAAARYWFNYLYENPDLLMRPRKLNYLGSSEYGVGGMGVEGLEVLLTYLRDERNLIKGMLAQAQGNLPFYAVCHAANWEEYVKTLSGYLQNNGYFPFNQFGIGYLTSGHESLIHLFSLLNQQNRFEQIKLFNCLQPEESNSSLTQFLHQLAETAAREGWTSTIIIEELENKTKTVLSKKKRSLRSAYSYLNNVILDNRRAKLGQFVVSEIPVLSKADEANIVEIAKPSLSVTSAVEPRPSPTYQVSLPEDTIWPLNTGVSLQMQMQVEQQQEQQQQIKLQQQEQVHARSMDIALEPEELVGYHNINTLLGEYYKELANEPPGIDETKATLRGKTDSVLQGFFRTWINANPDADARYVYHYLTKDAAKYLLRCHRRLVSGFNTDARRPGELYPQRTKDGKLFLCYQVEGVQPATDPLTVKLNVEAPQAKRWSGDFRQLDLETYRKVSPEKPEVRQDDLHLMAAFAALQPDWLSRDVQLFYEMLQGIGKSYPDLNESILNLMSQRLENSLILYQAWEYAGRQGVEAFLKQPQIACSAQAAIKRLFANRPVILQQITELDFTDEAHFKALGQLYYAYGIEGVEALLKEFTYFKAVLGETDFLRLKQTFLAHCNNWGAFLAAKECIPGLRTICQTLSNPANDRFKSLWWRVVDLHIQGVGFESPEIVWNGFWHFIKALEEEGVELNVEALNQVKPANMLVWMDRVLTCLAAIPDPGHKQYFLNHLSSEKYDLTHGGLPYALQYEGFTTIDPALELHDFHLGNPTYAPDLANIYNQAKDKNRENLQLQIRRLFAIERFTPMDSQALSTYFDQLIQQNDPNLIPKLISLLSTDREGHSVKQIIQTLEAMGQSPLCAEVAGILHRTVYVARQPKPQVSLSALSLLLNPAVDASFLRKMPQACQSTYLELVTILLRRGVGKAFVSAKSKPEEAVVTKEDLNELYRLSQSMLELSQVYKEPRHRLGFKLAALFGQSDPEQINRFFALTQQMRPSAQRGLSLLVKQLFSINWQNSCLTAEGLVNPENWDGLLHCIEQMNQNLHDTHTPRQTFITALRQKGVIFKYDDKMNFRTLGTEDRPSLRQLNFFGEYEHRLWAFLQAHVVVEDHKDVQQSLAPLLGLLRKLQLKPRSYLNEMEPLLKVLEQAPRGHYWHVDYLCGLLKAIEPDHDYLPYPMRVLHNVLAEPFFQPQPLEEVSPELEDELTDVFKQLLKNSMFDRAQQAQLCQLAAREYAAKGSFLHHHEIATTLATDGYSVELRNIILSNLLSSKNIEQSWQICKALLHCKLVNPYITQHWPTIYECWLNALENDDPVAQSLFAEITKKGNEHTTELLLHIVAFSTLQQGLKSDEQHQDELNRKAPKLVEALTRHPEILDELAKCYPQVPCPTIEDLLRMVKRIERDHVSVREVIDEFRGNPYGNMWADYAELALTRETDFQRMLQESRCVVNGQEERPLNLEETARLSLMFAYLKQLEDGSETIAGYRIKEMTQSQLAAIYQSLSAAEKTDKVMVQLWALRFAALGSTIKKYPHLAQQFITIAHDIGLKSPSKVLCLGTGEGKSHFVALRAAHYATMGKKVVIQTAKPTLAARDKADYQAFFNYLGINAACLDQHSSAGVLSQNQVVYTTTGNFSLYLDNQTYNGNPIEINKSEWVGLFDEIDFIYFDEGIKTEYNFAIQVGKTPQQMRWFYQATNAFYQQNADFLKKHRGVNKPIVQAYVDYLLAIAGQNESKQREIERLVASPKELIGWLQAAHNAHRLVRGHDFAVTEGDIGKEKYQLRDIIPLSLDKQRMDGANFSDGVHQLLAEKLNTEALAQEETADFHVPPLSEIISTQIASTRLHSLFGIWEGYTGTFSDLQAEQIYDETGTEVFRMPTNRPDLREWKDPQFFNTREELLTAVITDIGDCFAANESILFACKDDVEVEALQASLKQKVENGTLDERIYNQIIFFTNENKQTSEQILKEKKRREQGKQSEPSQGIGLAASGLGRGDNVGVKAVFLFYAENKNDLLQKGGRTARNGERGTVYQFYVWPEIQAQYQTALKWMEMEDKTIHQEIEKIAAKKDEKVRTHERLLYLRERLTASQNQTKIGYKNMLAGYSAWAMQIIGRLAKTDQTEAKIAFRNRWIAEEKSIATAWREISTDQNLSTQQKLEAICEKINSSSETFVERCRAIVGFDQMNVSAYEATVPKQQLTRKSKLIKSQINVAQTTNNRLIASALLRLKVPATDWRWEQVRHQLTTLEKDPKNHEAFAKRASKGFVSFDAFLNELDAAYDKKNYFSQIAHYIPPNQKELRKLYRLYPAFFASFAEKAAVLPEFLRESLVKSLLVTPTLCQQSADVFAVIDFLSQLSPDKQQQLGEAYAVNLATVVKHKNLAAYLTEPKMAFEQRQALWQFVQRYIPDDKQLAELFPIVIKAVHQGNPEERTRWLDEWAVLARNLNKQDASSFLQSFCQVIQQCSSKEEESVFSQLLTKSSQWWNKDRGNFQPRLVRLWQQMAQHQSSLLFNAMKPVIQFPGKEWFECALVYTALDSRVLADNQQWIADKFVEFAASLTLPSLEKKRIKLNRFAAAIKPISVLSPLYVNYEQEVRSDQLKAYYQAQNLNQTASAPYLVEFANDFYAGVKQYQGDVSQIIQHLPFNDLFEFTSNDPSSRQKRIAWMQLLHHEIFVSRDPTLWQKHSNEALLKHCFAFYKRRADKILQQTKPHSIVGDLSSEQHAKLLHLSQELQEIAGTEPKVMSHISDPINKLTDTEEKIAVLEKTMRDAIEQYALVSKSSERGHQLEQLEQDLNSAFKHRYGTMSRYESLLMAISEAQQAAVLEDEKINKKRPAWFKFNRNGSRYLDTLNSLHQLILQHWVADANAIPGFCHYQEKFSNRLHQSVKALQVALGAPLENPIQRSDDTALTELKTVLREISNGNQLNPDQMTALLLYLHHDLASLPTHTRQLAQTLLMQSKAFVLYHDQQTYRPERQKERELLAKVIAQLDHYEASLAKSSSRIQQFFDLRVALVTAMMNPQEGCYETLLTAIADARESTVVDDINHRSDSFFNVHRSGHSRYLNLLTDLEELIVSDWVKNEPDAQQQQQDKVYLERKLETAQSKLRDAMQKLIQKREADKLFSEKILESIKSHPNSHDDKEGVPGVDAHADTNAQGGYIDYLLMQKAKARMGAAKLDNKGESMQTLSYLLEQPVQNNLDRLNNLLKETRSLSLPVELTFLANEVLDSGDKLMLHYKDLGLPRLETENSALKTQLAQECQDLSDQIQTLMQERVQNRTTWKQFFSIGEVSPIEIESYARDETYKKFENFRTELQPFIDNSNDLSGLPHLLKEIDKLSLPGNLMDLVNDIQTLGNQLLVLKEKLNLHKKL